MEIDNEKSGIEQKRLNEEDMKLCRDGADLIIQWTNYPPYSICSVSSRMFGFLKDEHKQLVKKYIEECKDEDQKNAALLHFNFIDTYHSNDLSSNEFYKLLIDTISDKKLTLEYANNLYKSCHEDTCYTLVPEKSRSAISKWVAPDLKSSAWQETVKQVNIIALKKLQDELHGLDAGASIALLERAKTMPIFNEHTSNFRITGAFGRTSPVQWIDFQLNKLKLGPSEYQALRFEG